MSPKGYHAVVAALCQAEGWPMPTAEYVFAPPRKWRFDLAWRAQWLAVEIQGGTFIAGRHVRGGALRHEYEKTNAAAICGWVVLLVLPEQVTDGTLTALLAQYFQTWWPSHFAGRGATP